jgi:hypothetical protein
MARAAVRTGLQDGTVNRAQEVGIDADSDAAPHRDGRHSRYTNGRTQ